MNRKLYIVYTFRPKFVVAQLLSLFTTTQEERKAGEAISHVSLLYDAHDAPDVALIAHSTKWARGNGVQISKYVTWKKATKSEVVAIFELPGQWCLAPVVRRLNAKYDLANWFGNFLVIVARWLGRRKRLPNFFGKAEDEVCSELVLDTFREQPELAPSQGMVVEVFADLDPEKVTAPDLYRRMKAHPAIFKRVQ